MKRTLYAILALSCAFLLLASSCTMTDNSSSTTDDAGSTTAAVPSAPALSATALSNSVIKVSWAQISTATGYIIYRATSESGTYSTIATFTVNTTVSLQDTDLSAGTTYYYKGVAVNSSGKSSESSVVNATTLASTDTTDTTTEDTESVTLLDTPASVTLTVNSAKSITIAWTEVSGSTGYVIYRSTDNSTFSSIYSATYSSSASDALSYVDTGLSSSTTYYYAVATTNSAGTGSMSTAVSATTSASSTSSEATNGNDDSRGIATLSSDKVANTTFANTLYLNLTDQTYSSDDTTYTAMTTTATAVIDAITVKAKKNIITVDTTSATGAFILNVTGTLSSGHIAVKSDADTPVAVELYLNGVTITSGNYPAIEVKCEAQTFVVLNGTNTLTDGRTYGNGYGDDYTDTEADATDDIAYTTSWVEDGEDTKGTLYSKGQMLFSGSGSLAVTSAYKHCIYSKDYIHVYDGTITTTNSGRNGIQCVNGFIMDGGTISITGTGKNTNNESRGIIVEGSEDQPGEGFIIINGGTLTSNTYSKGISAKWDIDEDAETSATTDDPYPYLMINGGTVTVTTTATPQDDSSSTYTFTDADGVSTTETTSISPEGLEGKQDVFITGGTVKITTTDDCINASSSSGVVKISGGTIYAFSSDNDAIDSNGTLTITGGTIVALTTTTPECAFDCDQNAFTITGGLLVGIGTSNYSNPTASSCTQNAVVVAASYAPAGGTMAIVNGSDCVFAFTVPTLSTIASIGGSNTYDVMVLSSPNIKSNTTYTIYKNATVTGDTFNGLYNGSMSYSAGTSTGTFTTSSTVTTVGSISNGGSQEGTHTNGGPGGTTPGGNF